MKPSFVVSATDLSSQKYQYLANRAIFIFRLALVSPRRRPHKIFMMGIELRYTIERYVLSNASAISLRASLEKMAFETTHVDFIENYWNLLHPPYLWLIADSAAAQLLFAIAVITVAYKIVLKVDVGCDILSCFILGMARQVLAAVLVRVLEAAVVAAALKTARLATIKALAASLVLEAAVAVMDPAVAADPLEPAISSIARGPRSFSIVLASISLQAEVTLAPAAALDIVRVAVLLEAAVEGPKRFDVR